ncbi:MAG: deoxyhypusine synthase family protein [Candidatus Margulisbacteria bacterium]|nr:deoxyhypusine synthase family protein [Candidatus Margulisiibacteriota bacterium]
MGKNKDFEEKDYASLSYPKLSPENQSRRNSLLGERVKQLELGNNTSVAELVEAMSDMSIQARNIGQCAQVLKNIYQDKDRPTVFLGLAGPLIAAGLRKVLHDLVVNKAVDVVVSTGAIIYQDIYASFGHGHFKGTPRADDPQLNDLNIDRIYDTYIDEEKVVRTDRFCKLVADEMEQGNYSSRSYLDKLAERIEDEESILYQCHKHGVPIIVPALNDSSIGIGLTEHRVRAQEAGKQGIAIDSIQDNHELVQIVIKSPKTAAFYVAGGVPKNYINDSIVMSYIYGFDRGHDYALQITTAVTQDGGLSSSTLSEGRSWGKIKKEARFAMAWVEPSVSLPLLAGYVFGKELTKNRPRLKFDWEKDQLKCLKTI